MATQNLVLRTIYLDPDMDDQLRTEAFDKRKSKNGLMRYYLSPGMQTARREQGAGAPAKRIAADIKQVDKHPPASAAHAAVGKAGPVKRPAVQAGPAAAPAPAPARARKRSVHAKPREAMMSAADQQAVPSRRRKKSGPDTEKAA